MKKPVKEVTRSERPPARTSRVRTTKVHQVRTILVPVDFSAESKNALRYAIPLARLYRAKLTLLNVIEATGFPDFSTSPLALAKNQVLKSAQIQLDRLSGREVKDPRLLDQSVVRAGVPFHEICALARSAKFDLIIIATHGYTGWKHALIGSTAEKVIRHAPCPVLTVRALEQDYIPSPSP